MRAQYEDGTHRGAVSRGRGAGRRAGDDAIAVIADACRSHRTTPQRLLALIEQMPRNMRLRRFLRDLLADVAKGAYSFLEVHYPRDVERPHGLPTGSANGG